MYIHALQSWGRYMVCCRVLMFNYTIELWWVSKCIYQHHPQSWKLKVLWEECEPMSVTQGNAIWLGPGTHCTGVHALLIQDSQKGPASHCCCPMGHVPAPPCLSSPGNRDLLRKNCCLLQVDLFFFLLFPPFWSWNLLEYCCGMWSWLKSAWGCILYKGYPQFLAASAVILPDFSTYRHFYFVGSGRIWGWEWNEPFMALEVCLSIVCSELPLVSGVRALVLFKVCCSFSKALVPVTERLHDFLIGRRI